MASKTDTRAKFRHTMCIAVDPLPGQTYCQCVCPSCYHSWSVQSKVHGGKRMVGRCICRACPCRGWMGMVGVA